MTGKDMSREAILSRIASRTGSTLPTPSPADPSEIVLTTEWPAPLAEAAYIGPIGQYVREIEGMTEANAAAILLQELIMFGSIVGRSAHVRVGADKHYANEFAVIVGATSGGKKGTSLGIAKHLFDAVDDKWLNGRVMPGLSSGEGVIWAVRDPVIETINTAKKGQPACYEEVITDPGEEDKRLLITETEFVGVLKQAERQGNTLSGVLRQAWDSGGMRILTKNSPARATGAHVSIIGHITPDELNKYLSEVEAANGFGNRFLWFLSKRSRLLPDAPHITSRLAQAQRAAIAAAVEQASTRGELARDATAQRIWCEVYGTLERERHGMVGAMLARAAPHVLRLSLIYALAELSATITARHLAAALAVWEYSERSVQYLFGDATGDSVADDILRLVRASSGGVTRTDISHYFGRNIPSSRLSGALSRLMVARLIRSERVMETGGRPTERYHAVGGGR